MSGGPFSPTKTTASTASTQTTSLTTTNKNVSGNTGLTVTADEGADVDLSYAPITVQTDDNAVAAGAYVANAGIAASTSAAALVSKTAHDAVAANSDIALASINSSSGLEDHALDIVDATRADSAKLAGSVLTYNADLISGFAERLSDITKAGQTQLGNTVSALNASFIDNSKTADQRVTDATLQAGAQSADVITTVAKYAAIAVAVGVIGYIVLKKG